LEGRRSGTPMLARLALPVLNSKERRPLLGDVRSGTTLSFRDLDAIPFAELSIRALSRAGGVCPASLASAAAAERFAGKAGTVSFGDVLTSSNVPARAGMGQRPSGRVGY